MNAPAKTKRKQKLGEQLVKKGLVTIDQIEIAITEQKKGNGLIGEILVELGFISESVMRDVLSQVLGLGSMDLNEGNWRTTFFPD